MRADWVKVRLTEFGAAVAGGGEIIVVSGRRQWKFRAGEPQEVTRVIDWGILQRRKHDGQPLFETVAESRELTAES